jgi:hypothetical protein
MHVTCPDQVGQHLHSSEAYRRLGSVTVDYLHQPFNQLIKNSDKFFSLLSWDYNEPIGVKTYL